MKKKTSSNEETEFGAYEVADMLRGLISMLGPSLKSEAEDAPLHQLPAPPAEWLGRVAELAALRARLEGGTAAGVVLHGPAGVGKTALALKLAVELSGLYSDAQFYLDMRGGAGLQPLAPADVMAHVMHSYQPARILPETVTELSPRYAATLRGRRTLLLLDDVADAAQLEAVLPPAGCVVLATAAQPLKLPGLFNLPLEPWPAEMSREYLLQHLPRLGKHAASLAELCGGLPLALRLIVGLLQVQTTQKLTAAACVKQLAAARNEQEPLAAALALADELMAFIPQGLWRELAVFQGSFDEEAAASVWDMKLAGQLELPDLFFNLLKNLLRRGVLEKDEAARRYRLHDAARAVADARLADDARARVARLHAKHYLEALQAATLLFKSGVMGSEPALEIFDRERLNIAAGRAWAVAHAATDPEAAGWAADYFAFGTPLLIHRLRAAELQQWLREAVAANHGDAKTESELLGQLGVSYQNMGDQRRAVEFMEKAVAAARASDDQDAIRRALGGLADARHAAGAYDEAAALYRQYIEIARAQGDRRGESYVLNNLGAVYGKLGRKVDALACFARQLEIARELGDRENEARVLGNFGIVHITSGDAADAPAAIEYFQQALAVYRKLRARDGVAETLRNLGAAYLTAGEAHRAIELFEESADLYHQLGDSSGASEALSNQSMALEKLGQRARAIECAEAALKLCGEGDHARVAQLRQQLMLWRMTEKRPRYQGH